MKQVINSGVIPIMISMSFAVVLAAGFLMIEFNIDPPGYRPPPGPILPYTEDVDIHVWTKVREQAIRERERPFWDRFKEDILGKQR